MHARTRQTHRFGIAAALLAAALLFVLPAGLSAEDDVLSAEEVLKEAKKKGNHLAWHRTYGDALLEARVWQILDNEDLDPMLSSDLSRASRAEDLLNLAAANEEAVARRSLEAEVRHWRSGK